jgi:DNA-binding LacI/PurR family transcriptional regulator
MQPVAMTEPSIRTIADVARLLGVSKSTVSRALNDSPLIGADTKARVRAAAQRHHFRMNASARRLSLRESRTIGLVTYPFKAGSQVSDVFMLEILSGISGALAAGGHDLLIITVDKHDTGWVHEFLETGRVDGFILLSATCSREQMTELVERKAPFTIWGADGAGRLHCSVSGDGFTGGRMAVEHLIERGRNRIGFLGGPAGDSEVRDRLRGYRAALRAAGRPVDPALIANGDYSEQSGAATMGLLLDRAPDLDAVFVNSDLMAVAAMDVIRERGRVVPDHVAVIGYDDVSIARYSNPPLTTIRQNGPLAGRLLAENLLQYLHTGVVTNVSIPAELVMRSSA